MRDNLSAADRAKIASAYEAMSLVEDGMLVGLGTGSTAAWLVRLLGARMAMEGLKFTAVSTSEATEVLAREVGIVTTTLDAAEWLDLTIDGADEFDPDLQLIKGGGGALLREKIVACASDRMVVISDDTKQVSRLGAFALPVEVVRFAWSTTRSSVAEVLEDADVAGRRIVPRMRDGSLFVTDEGHHILDLHLGEIGNAAALARDLCAIPGVVETGLFIDVAAQVCVGTMAGMIRNLDRTGTQDERALGDPDRLERLLAHFD